MEIGASRSTGALVQGDRYQPSQDGSLTCLDVDRIDPTLLASMVSSQISPIAKAIVWRCTKRPRSKSNYRGVSTGEYDRLYQNDLCC